MLITLKLITKFEKRSLIKKLSEKEYVAPWEKAFSKVLTPLEEFIHRQTTSGILLMLWLYQRHALKACRASVGDEEGHRKYSRF
ncbi:MAG: hypothetical protein IH802_10470 [Nitrospinae bacterium]|nr:hypothetical protein [Nitrospinota bacterium]